MRGAELALACLANDRTYQSLSTLFVAANGSTSFLACEDGTVSVNVSLHCVVWVLLWEHEDGFRAEWTLRQDPVLCGSIILLAVVVRWLPVFCTKALSAVGTLEWQKVDCSASIMAARCPGAEKVCARHGEIGRAHV